jgi:two-component system sensor histidine kinase QseC
LRRKFFLIIFGFLCVTILVVSTLQQFYFSTERKRLMDQRLETIASSLIASGLSLSLIENLESTDDLIHDLLGDERVDLLINIYSLNGTLLAQNYTAAELPLVFNPSMRWQSYEVKKRQVRVLNLQNNKLLIQVGMIVDPWLNRTNLVWNLRFVGFLFVVSLLLLAAAYMSSSALFSPLRRLTYELEVMSRRLDRRLGQSLSEFEIGPELSRLAQGGSKSKDEFELLCVQIEGFLRGLEDYARSFNAQTAILTHELKTPLTILKNYLEELKRAKSLEEAQLTGTKSLSEVDQLTVMISDYLQWSVLTSNPGQPNELYALKLSETATKIALHLNTLHNQRIDLQIKNEVTVFAMPSHLQQLVINLLTNALNYSPESSKVICEVCQSSLKVKDEGSGIPASVLEYLGQPFNRGTQKNLNSRSTGLGLAWVHSLTEKYKWKLDIQTGPKGTSIEVVFG